ncbi:MAG TPA: pilin [Usitatibacteraceae bacterium]|jgi:hypothetical protein|nr:pilin [Usitatibacteraceae bacterium]HRA23064.1 pilin [Usitatibacteraceae bacterium]
MRPFAARRQGGFRLLGLSPVFWLAIVAVAGIVAVLAIPADALYVPRRKVAEVTAVAEACRQRVDAFARARKHLPRDAVAAGCESPASRHAIGLAVDNGLVRVTIAAVGPGLDGRFLAYEPLDGNGRPADGTQPITRWRCATDADLRDPLVAALPAECRQPPA